MAQEYTTYHFISPYQPVKKTRTIHDVMNETVRRIYGRVEITYTDPFIDKSLMFDTNRVGRYTYPIQVANAEDEPTHKWFSLHDNSLDGSYHPLPSEASSIYEVGVWDAVLSEENGVLPSPFIVSVSFDPRPVRELKVTGDNALNVYPVDFDVLLLGEDETVLYEANITGNTEVDWTQEIEPVTSVTETRLIVHRINRANNVAKILEFYTGITETYEGDDIFEISLLEEQEYDSGSIPIGNVSSNEIDVRLNNIDHKFSPGNEESVIRELLLKNRRIRAWLGAEVVPGEIEWHPLGLFWTLDWDVPEEDAYAATTGRDRLEILKDTDLSISQVYENISLYDLAELVLRDAGLSRYEYVIDQSLRDIIIRYGWFDRMSHREALRQIAVGCLGRVYCDRQGRIIVERFRPDKEPVFDFRDDLNVFSKDHPLAWTEIKNRVEVIAAPYRKGEIEEIYSSDEPFTIPSGERHRETVMFDQKPCIEVKTPVIDADSNIQLVDYTTYAWGVDLVFENVGESAGTVNSISISGRPLEQKGSISVVREDARSIRDNGEITVTIENPFIQTRSRAVEIAEGLLETLKNPRRDISMDTRGNIALRLGDVVTAPEFKDEKHGLYYIARQDITWDGGLRVNIDAVRAT